jgi:hypothetical protein
MLERSTAADHVTPIDLPMTSRLIAQMKADSSRAIGSSRYRRGAGARLRCGSPRDRLGDHADSALHTWVCADARQSL